MAKIAVITGAGAGVGRATADMFAKAGYDVALLSRDPDRLERAADEARRFGVRALPIPTDVADAEAVDAAADRVERELGPIDVWVNVAMATVFAPVSKLTAEEVKRGTEVTYLGQVHGMMSALKRMRTRNRGTIVNVGSALAYRSVPLQSIYCGGAKFAIRGFTDSLRSEIIHDKLDVHVTMVDLPAVNTPQFDWAMNKTGFRAQPVPPIYEPDRPAPSCSPPRIVAARSGSGSHREGHLGQPRRARLDRQIFGQGRLYRAAHRHAAAEGRSRQPVRARAGRLRRPWPLRFALEDPQLGDVHGPAPRCLLSRCGDAARCLCPAPSGQALQNLTLDPGAAAITGPDPNGAASRSRRRTLVTARLPRTGVAAVIRSQLVRTLTRLSLVCLFPPSGLDKIINWDESMQQAKSGILPGAPALLAASVVLETLAPVAIVAEKHDREAAALLAGFCAVTAVVYHQFWTYDDLMAKQKSEGREHLWEFLKNFGLVGGLMFVALEPKAPRLAESARGPTPA